MSDANVVGHPDWNTVNWESGLVKHAWVEYQILGEEYEYVRPILEMLTIFASMGHSGGSASVFVPQINSLLQHQALSALTNDPTEWIDQSDKNDGRPIWQNLRDSRAMSQNAGKTYWLVDEPSMGPANRKMYTSKEKVNA